MDLSRISKSVDVLSTQRSRICIVGVGGSAGLACDLARSGLGNFILVDMDTVDAVNVARQGHNPDQIGIPKTEALASQIKVINPDATVTCLHMDFTTMTDDKFIEQFADIDLLIMATDSFKAQARGNQAALLLNVPAIWPGLYRGGGAGEIIFWHPGLDPCFRCLVRRRYTLQAEAAQKGQTLDPPSDGATIYDIHLLDSIVGQLAIGLLTRGADNRFGRLIDRLGDRNFLQVKTDPDWTFAGRDIIREQLRIPDECDTYFSWNAIARRDPDAGQLPCPDCEKYRGHRFAMVDAKPVRNPPETHTHTDENPPTEDVLSI